MKFQKGDRVVAAVDYPNRSSYIRAGYVGTVLGFSYTGAVGVEWDNAFPEGHDLRGIGMDGHGWFVRGEEIALWNGRDEDDSVEIEESSFMGMIGGAK